jgi:putative ABC transport system substrate-binding protein
MPPLTVSRRAFVGGAVGLALAQVARAQSPPPSIAFIVSRFSRNPRLREAFMSELHSQGFVDGSNVIVVTRDVEGNRDLYAKAARELAAQKVAVIVAPATIATQAAMQATSTVPIVFVGDPDPVGSGLVKSLAHPGGNVTGVSNLGTELIGKRLELLREAVPGLKRVVALYQPGTLGAASEREMLSTAKSSAAALGIDMMLVETHAPADLESAFARMTKARADGLILPNPSPTLFGERSRIAELARTHRLASVFPTRDYVDAGGLMSYGPDFANSFRRAANQVARLLKGARAADIPVERPTEFELVVNLRTAATLSIALPAPLLSRAQDRVR